MLKSDLIAILVQKRQLTQKQAESTVETIFESMRVALCKGDNIELPAPYGCRVPARWLFGNRLLYQPILGEVARARLVILEQANKYLMSYPVLAQGRLKVRKVAFWGHGRNMHGRASSWAERWKRGLIRQVDWWFAYTQSAASYVAAQGFDPRRITNVRNSVDTAAFRELVESITPEEIQSQRARLGLTPDSHVLDGTYRSSSMPPTASATRSRASTLS